MILFKHLNYEYVIYYDGIIELLPVLPNGIDEQRVNKKTKQHFSSIYRVAELNAFEVLR